MKKYTQYIMSLVIVFSLLLLFAGCSQNENSDSGKSGEKYTVQFFVTGIEEAAESADVRSVTENKTPVVFTKTLDNGYTFTGILEEERGSDIHTRASAPVASNVFYGIVAYKDGGNALTDSRQGVFQVGKPAALTLPPGTYQLYAYSCNSTETGSAIELSGENLEKKRIPYEDHPQREFLFAKILKKVTIAADGSASDASVSIAFHRKSSKLTVQLDGVLSQKKVKSGKVTINPQKYGIFDCSLGAGAGGWNVTLSGNKTDLALADFPEAQGYKTTSNVYITPRTLSATAKLSIKLTDINIGIAATQSATLDITKYTFNPGVKYTMKIKVTPPSFDPWIEINGVKWARTNTRFAIGPKAVFFDYPFEFKNLGTGFVSYRAYASGDVNESLPSFGPLTGAVEWNQHRSRTCPAGYKLPTKAEIGTLLDSNVKKHWGTYNGVAGTFFTDDSSLPMMPTEGNEHLYLFLPAGGRQIAHITDQYIEVGSVGSYWSSSGDFAAGSGAVNSPDLEDNGQNSAWQAYCLTVQSSGATLPRKYCAVTKYCTIRCVVGTQNRE